MRAPEPTGASPFSRYPRIALTLMLLLAVTVVAVLGVSGLAKQKDGSSGNALALNATVAPTPAPTVESRIIPDPMATAVLPTLPPGDTATPTPNPRSGLESLASKASVVGEARIIGSESRTNSFTFIFYVHEWYKNEAGVKDNIVHLTLNTTRNWDNLVNLPRNLIGSTDGPVPYQFLLFLSGTPDNYSIVGDTVGIFYLGYPGENTGPETRIQTGTYGAQYQHMTIQQFREELRAVLHITPTPQPPTPTPLPTPADGSPVSLLKDGDNYLVYPHRGIIRFGVGGIETWLGPSRIRILWSSGKEPWEGKSYVADLRSGTLEEYNPTPEWYGLGGGYGSIVSPNGKRVLLMEGGNEVVWGVSLYDMVTKKEHTVFDRDLSVPQWAGADVHAQKKGLGPSNPVWLNDDLFLFAVGPSLNSAVRVSRTPSLLLANAQSHKVQVLSKEIGDFTPYYDGFGEPVIYQVGALDSTLMMLPPPYTGTPITLATAGPWIRDWIASPDGSRIAWVEATAPPGDWSEHLPYACIPCPSYGPKDAQRQKDPEPQVQAIAIWDATTQTVYRHKPDGLVWTLGSAYFSQRDALHWRTDNSALLYATHSDTPACSALYSLTPGEQPVLLADHPWDGTIDVLGDGADGSIYYYVTGRNYFASGDLVRRHPDGKLEVLHEYLTPNMWHLEPGKWLEVLGQGQVYVHDFATGNTRHARFHEDPPSPGQLDWSGTVGMVPLSPDGNWAAYSGASDALMSGPLRIMPDRGPAMQIVRVK